MDSTKKTYHYRYILVWLCPKSRFLIVLYDNNFLSFKFLNPIYFSIIWYYLHYHIWEVKPSYFHPMKYSVVHWPRGVHLLWNTVLFKTAKV